MKKYVKPSVKVVNLKSSSDIATTFSQIASGLTKNYLNKASSDQSSYTVSVYSNTASVTTYVE